MKILYLGICFALWICLDAKEVRQISRLIPLEDWIDFKTRTRDIKPFDKFIGKLRATYDFVFHKADNVSNVGKILDKTVENFNENNTKTDWTISLFERRNSTDLNIMKDNKGSDNSSIIKNVNEPIKTKTSTHEVPDDEIDQRFDKLEKLEDLDDTLTLERLEIVDDDDTLDMFDELPENVDKKNQTPHSSFALPYAIAQAIVRWLISLYYSTSSHPTHADPVTRESA